MFENFFEQSASTVRDLQKNLDEVVWGVESPPSVVEKKETTSRNSIKGGNKKSNTAVVRSTSKQQPPQRQQQQLQQRQNAAMPKPTKTSIKSRFFGTPTNTRGKKRNLRHQMASRHARHELAAASAANNNVQGTPTTDRDDSESTVSDPHSILEMESSDSSDSESEIMTRNLLSPNPSARAMPHSWKYASDSKNASNLNQTSIAAKTPTNMSINVSTANNNKSKKLDKKLQSGSRSIDEIFGYNTKQSLTKTKVTLDQDVGLDFMVLDVPLSSNSLKKRSLLIVQSIDPRGLFGKTDLGVGDAILSINGTSFGNQSPPRYARRTGPRGASSEKPNLFQARALLNGRSRSVTIEYQKFGETNSSVCSSTLAKQTQETAAQPQPTTVKPFASSGNPRRSSSNRVDFLGMIRTNKSPKHSKGKSTRSNTKNNSYSDSESSDEEDEGLFQQQQVVEAPPRISRLTKFKARTQKLRKTKAGGDVDNKENSPNSNTNSNGKQEVFYPAQATIGQPDSTTLPYCSLNYGPEKQIQLLKQRVHSSKTTCAPQTQPAHSPARSTFSDSKLGGCSPARSTRSESYLQDLRKGLSPTANAILADLSVGMTESNEEPEEKKEADGEKQLNPLIIPSTNLSPDPHQQELNRINRKVFEKLQLRVEFLKKNNMELKNEVAALKRNSDSSFQKLAQAEKQLEQNDAKEQVYVSQVDLLKSRLEINTIQADKRHRELLEAKEKSIANNDKVISNLSKRIEGLEGANKRLIEQLKKVETKRQEKQGALQAQFDRLKMKFSAQSTLLDNVMTSNEELTSQNEAMEAELQAYADAASAKSSNNHTESHRPPLAPLSPTTTGMLFAEGSESELEHIKRDPILLAQAKELSSSKEKNAQLEDQVENLSKRLAELTAEMNSKSAPTPIVGRREPPAGRISAISTPSLLDVTLTSTATMSSCEDDLPEQEEDHRDPSASVENPSDEEVLRPATNTYQLEYQHEYGASGDDETVSTSNHSRNRRQSPSPSQDNDESFDSVSSLALMERILELETELQKSNLAPQDSEKFLVALQARISKLNARGYEKVSSLNLEQNEI